MKQKLQSLSTSHPVCGTLLRKSERENTPPESATSSKPSTSKNDLTAEYLRKTLSYDPETGVFTWKWREDKSNKLNGRQTGKVAGTLTFYGYIHIGINQRYYRGHRLAWLYVYGVWPIDQLDHINGNRADNRIFNLREATDEENRYNRKIYTSNSTGVAGVYWDIRVQKYLARISKGRKRHRIGWFDTLEAAATARAAAEIKYFGEFRRSE